MKVRYRYLERSELKKIIKNTFILKSKLIDEKIRIL